MDPNVDLSTLTDDELGEYLSNLTAEFDRLHDEGSRDIPAMTALADAITSAQAEQTKRQEQAAEEDAAIADLHGRVHPPEEVEIPQPGDEPTAEDDDETEPVAEADEEPVLVTAAATAPTQMARRVTPAAIASRAPRISVREPRRSPIVITAAADLPGVPVSSQITPTQIAQAFHDKARNLQDHSPMVPIARVDTTSTWLMEMTDNPATNYERLQTIAARGRGFDAAQVLTASGGWCAPSQPLYELFEITDTDGLIDLPTVGAVRGGLLVPTFWSFGDITAGLWTWSEANDVSAATQPAGPDKTCVKIPCPTWTDVRLGAEGLCVTHGNLADRAFPEGTRAYVNTVMAAHEHRVSAAKIATIVADATSVTLDATMLNSDAAGDVLGSVEMMATDLRSRYRASENRAVEVLLPTWARGALRANMAKRAGVNMLSISNAEITGWFTDRNVRPQFLSDYQPLFNSTPSTRWPANLEMTLFFAGSYVVGDGGSIDLGVVRDSTLNSTNDYTAAWSEQFYLVANPGPNATKATVALGIDGVTACCPVA